MIHLEVEEESRILDLRLCHRSTKTCCDIISCINTQPLHRCHRCTNNHHLHTRYAPAAALSATTFWTPPLSASKSKAGQDSADPWQRSHSRCRCFRSPASVDSASESPNDDDDSRSSLPHPPPRKSLPRSSTSTAAATNSTHVISNAHTSNLTPCFPSPTCTTTWLEANIPRGPPSPRVTDARGRYKRGVAQCRFPSLRSFRFVSVRGIVSVILDKVRTHRISLRC